MRVAAFAYAFDHDLETSEDRTKWLFVVEPDIESEAIVRALASYPVTTEPVDVEGALAFTDKRSGKQVAYWSVKVREEKSSRVMLDVGCVKGGLNGYGQTLVMKKVSGRWVVDESLPGWIS